MSAPLSQMYTWHVRGAASEAMNALGNVPEEG